MEHTQTTRLMTFDLTTLERTRQELTQLSVRIQELEAEVAKINTDRGTSPCRCAYCVRERERERRT